MASPSNLLDFLREHTQVDCDSQNPQVATDFAPLVDCTSNQIDTYEELMQPRREAILRKSVKMAIEMHEQYYPDMPFEDLAAEISAVNVILTMVPVIPGRLCIMANPRHGSSSFKMVETCQRIVDLVHRINPAFDLSRIAIKVVGTWEGIQACHKLSKLGIATVLTTTFTMEQITLAGEAGCKYISPFCHSLDALVQGRPSEVDLDVCVKAHAYYKQHSLNTKVKAAAIVDANEAMKLAGVASMTLPPSVLQELRDTQIPADVEQWSLILAKEAANLEYKTYMGNEEAWREAFNKSGNGRGKALTEEAISVFCGYQDRLEELMQTTLSGLRS